VVPQLTTRSTETIGVEEASLRLSVSRQTVYDWIQGRRLIGWQSTGQGMQIPSEQILGYGEIISGLDKVLELIPNSRAAWRFLN
jgi:excisionase family DNA binding protein